MYAYTYRGYHTSRSERRKSNFYTVGNLLCSYGNVRRVRKLYRLASDANDDYYWKPKGCAWLVKVKIVN